MSRQHFGERRFPRPVRPHDGVNFAAINCQVDAPQNLFAFDRRM
jgi:hypothetical protein